VITVVIPVSPINSHPTTTILAKTVESVRHWLPTAEIMLCFDGVRTEQERLRRRYESHIFAALELADWQWGNVCPFIFDEHLHQTGMLRKVIDDIRTPLMMFVEQDTPLVTDEPIDFDAITDAILSGVSNMVRLHHEALILPDHEHMVHGEEPGTPLLRTSQWSQRPHVASVAYYRRILDAHFTKHTKSFVEDKMHGVLDQAYRVDGLAGWLQHRIHIYNPGNGNIKRSYHTDGRAGDPKWDNTQIF
jgi:hypothetical protein